jgi:hypothetical protein
MLILGNQSIEVICRGNNKMALLEPCKFTVMQNLQSLLWRYGFVTSYMRQCVVVKLIRC